MTALHLSGVVLPEGEHRELWVEVDASGPGQRLKFDAKQMVASQFASHGIAPRLDDGWFGNDDNGLLAYQEVLRPTDLVNFRNDDSKFRPERRALPGGVFRYALLVDEAYDVDEAISDPVQIPGGFGPDWQRVGQGMVETAQGPALVMSLDKLIKGPAKTATGRAA